MAKKTLWTIVAVVAVLAVIVCIVVFSNSKETGVDGSLEDIMEKIYAGIPADNLPALATMELDSENIKQFVGTDEISFKEALVSEPMISSIPHSVVLLRLNSEKDATSTVAKIKENANPRKWICVEASNVIVKSKGDLVILIMCDSEIDVEENTEIAPKLEANFNNL